MTRIGLKYSSMMLLDEEVERARGKFPNPQGLVPALFEEFGEYCDEQDPAKRRKELLQVACVAMRLYEEGDPYEEAGMVRALKRFGAILESKARAVLAELIGEAAAARSNDAPEQQSQAKSTPLLQQL